MDQTSPASSPTPPARELFAPEPLSVRLRRWRPRGLQFGLLASALFHLAVIPAGLVLWTWVFGPIDYTRVFQETPLEVILVNARTHDAPTKAQAIAQANLAGGGEAQAGLATSPLPPSPSNMTGEDEDLAARTIQAAQQEQQQLLTQIRRQVAQLPVPDPRKPLTQAEREQEERRQRMLRTLAEIEKRINEENARPRRRYISPATREEIYAIYYDALRRKIEDRGTRDFPTLNGHKLYGELTMNLTIDARGRVVEAEIERSSNSRWLDQRAIAIARAAAPFGHFSDDMRRNADQIVVTSRFRFTKSDGLETTLTTSGG